MHGKAKKGGKENESELTNMIGEKTKLRLELKENDNRNRVRIEQLTTFYERQIEELRKNAADKEASLIKFYDADIDSLREVIKAKQAEIERLVNLNKELKVNEDTRLKEIKSNNE